MVLSCFYRLLIMALMSFPSISFTSTLITFVSGSLQQETFFMFTAYIIFCAALELSAIDKPHSSTIHYIPHHFTLKAHSEVTFTKVTFASFLKVFFFTPLKKTV